MIYRLEDCCVDVGGTIRDAMRSLERSGVEIVLVMEGERLAGVVTDGDLRRGLLKGASLDSALAPQVQRDFTAVRPEIGRADVLDLMRARTLEQIPILDSNRRLAGLHLLHELIGSVERPNWAVIMAGGRGVRLNPLTEHLPKPMLRVAGRPILERLVLHLVGFGIRRIFLSINYLGHLVEDHFGDGRKFGCRIEYLRETRALGTGGSLSLLPQAPTHPLLVLNGDIVTQADIGALLQFHAAGSHAATMGVRDYCHEVPFGCVEMTDGRVTGLVEKPFLRRWVNTGLYVLGPDLIPRVPGDTEYPITRLFEECLLRKLSIGAYELEDDWIDIGRREQLKLARGGGI